MAAREQWLLWIFFGIIVELRVYHLLLLRRPITATPKRHVYLLIVRKKCEHSKFTRSRMVNMNVEYTDLEGAETYSRKSSTSFKRVNDLTIFL